MTKTGIVTQINKNKIFLMTSSGEFAKVKSSKKPPSIGQVYTGEVLIERPVYRMPLMAASILFCILFSGGMFAYYTPVAAVTIDINPSVKLSLNRWDKIIKAEPLNDDGKKVLQGITLNNKSVDDGLELIVEQAKKDNFIDDTYKTAEKAITVRVDGKNHDKVDLSDFEASVKQQDIKVNILDDADNTKVNEKSSQNDNNSSDNKSGDNGKSKENKQDKTKDKGNSKSQNKSSNDKKNSNNQIIRTLPSTQNSIRDTGNSGADDSDNNSSNRGSSKSSEPRKK